MPQLKTFPVSVKVAGRKIVIVGGGIEALNKTRLALKTEAEVVVVAREIEAGFDGLAIARRERAFEADDLDDAALVFVAEDSEDGRVAQAEARARNIPLNVVDVPHACDFYTPAIVDRAPLTIAISSEGAAPVLARQVRARIEAMLSPNLGKLAGLAGALRDKVAEWLPEGPERRRYFEKLTTDANVEAALDLGVSEAWKEAVGLLERQAETGESEGFVWLIGAGPGAEDLLTLRAQRILQQADIIVHDQLVPDEVVEMGRRDAERIKVGKAKGHHSFSQARINALLVRLAGEGKKVVRLKSGDPMIFGRAGEEIAALRKAGIEYQIVPGVTAALAAAADTATPVTLRKVSSGFVVATAHGADDSEITHWAGLAAAGLTIGIYMGKSIAADVAQQLIGKGLSAETPVGMVVNAGRKNQTRYAGSLCSVANGVEALADGPAIIFVGAAVAAGDWAEALPFALSKIEVA